MKKPMGGVTGVATGTLFHHFKTKEELINALYVEIKTEISETFTEGLVKTRGIKAKFRFMWYNYVSWAMGSLNKFHFLVQFSESRFITKLTKKRVGEMTFQFLAEIIEEGKKKGIFGNLPYDLFSNIANAVINVTARYFIENPNGFSDKKLADAAFSSFWNVLSKSS